MNPKPHIYVGATTNLTTDVSNKLHCSNYTLTIIKHHITLSHYTDTMLYVPGARAVKRNVGSLQYSSGPCHAKIQQQQVGIR